MARKPGAPKMCSVAGCVNRRAPGRSICATHRKRLEVHGDVLAHVPIKKVVSGGVRAAAQVGWAGVSEQTETRIDMLMDCIGLEDMLHALRIAERLTPSEVVVLAVKLGVAREFNQTGVTA